MLHAVVLQPPPGNVTGPSAAPAYLKSYAQGNGYLVQSRDVGIEAFHYLTAPRQLERLIETAGGMVVERFIQERPAPDPATVVGS